MIDFDYRTVAERTAPTVARVMAVGVSVVHVVVGVVANAPSRVGTE